MQYGPALGLSAGSSNVTASASQPGSVSLESEVIARQVNELGGILNRIEGLMNFPPRPEGLPGLAKQPDESRSGLAAGLRDSSFGLGRAIDRLSRIAEAL
jgi:hypothetical protein